MIRLTHVSGSLEGTTTSSDKHWLRVGTGDDCDLRYDPAREPRVARYHAVIVLKDGAYHILDLDVPGGLLVDGERVKSTALRSGDTLRFGAPDGPEARVDVTIDASYDPHQDAAEITKALQATTRESATGQILALTAQRIAEERARAGGTRSRKTMDHIAHAVREVSEVTRRRTKRRWVRVLGLVAGLATLIIGVMGAVISLQQRKIGQLLDTKGEFDQQIAAILDEMHQEQDTARLAQLEQLLQQATARAQRTLAELGRASKTKAEEVANAGDDLDREIRRILRQFDAETYAVPPIFKERLQYHIDRLIRDDSVTRATYQRKLRYWPIIQRELTALELPEVMGYLAWAESNFTPTATSRAGARGMWQMMPATARGYGLRVDRQVDERTNVRRQTRAAARHLANLLGEFGEDAFMLAMASYNRGENGVRRVLRQIAQTPGGFKREKRDFWHLYRLRLLPPETMEYVPRVLAAAVIGSHPERYGLPPPPAPPPPAAPAASAPRVAVAER
ncbi:MAG: transglycosylase SLT domain-containing protein [Gemmatimonadales bacterium]